MEPGHHHEEGFALLREGEESLEAGTDSQLMLVAIERGPEEFASLGGIEGLGVVASGEAVFLEDGLVLVVEVVLAGIPEEVQELLGPGIVQVGGALDDGSKRLLELCHIFLVAEVDLGVVDVLETSLVAPPQSLHLAQ